MTDPLSLLDAASPVALGVLGYRREWVPTAFGDVHVLRARGAGDLPPLVVVHGLGSSAADYAWAFGPLRRACREVILPDLFGHGASPKPDVPATELREAQLEVLAGLVPERAILIGNSLGGVVATQLYARVRERVAALILVSPGGAPMTDPELAGFMAEFDVNDPAAAKAFVARFLGRSVPWAGPYAWGVRQRMGRPEIRRFIQSLRATDLLTEADLAAITCPSLLFWGKGDGVIPESARDWWFRHLPHAVRHTPDHFGHAPFLDDPRGFAAPIVAFLKAVTATVPAAN